MKRFIAVGISVLISSLSLSAFAAKNRDSTPFLSRMYQEYTKRTQVNCTAQTRVVGGEFFFGEVTCRKPSDKVFASEEVIKPRLRIDRNAE